ncbi:membrane associated rhomboid family serine protease [Flavobacterium arsenatis]|uniref:Membrane associated rhomboid family serine protease n=1 Tax=Flavobacterium arsenatis TaxID=1484332 RepID=A0ABU1TPI8_9FLAO|nr:rhomboid family intramembrane serine protease [Flavobacterium arsenatis]MDR6967879.1 membrane associated rhomboid family serine protease [Flavobacterium arsenatis]
MNDNHFKFSLSVFVLPLLFVLLLWLVFWFEITYKINLTEYGIHPRTFTGLRGIIFSPFLHGSMEHLYNNSIPLFMLVAGLRYFYREHFFKIIGFGILLSGFLTWVIARDSYHIGASGLIYVLVSFMFFKGIMTKYYRLVALSLLIVTLYGSLIWYVFPGVEEGISWEGHLAGLITGFVFASIYKTPEYQKMIKYEWEKPDFDPTGDKFLERFDENGNFVNPPKPEPELEMFPEISSTSNFRITYHFIEGKDVPAGENPEDKKDAF